MNLNMCYTILHIDDEMNQSRKVNLVAIGQAMGESIPYMKTMTYRIQDQFELNSYYSQVGKFKVTGRLKYGELGCFASHYNAWKTLLDSEYDSLLVIEDDAIPLANFMSNLLESLEEIPQDFDVTTLFIHPRKQEAYNPLQHDIGLNRICKFYQRQSTMAYLISRNGAQKFIKFVNRGINDPLDLFLFDRKKKANIYSLKPEFDILFKTDTLDELGEVKSGFTNIQQTAYAHGRYRFALNQIRREWKRRNPSL